MTSKRARRNQRTQAALLALSGRAFDAYKAAERAYDAAVAQSIDVAHTRFERIMSGWMVTPPATAAEVQRASWLLERRAWARDRDRLIAQGPQHRSI